jgi:hypothetical protein
VHAERNSGGYHEYEEREARACALGLQHVVQKLPQAHAAMKHAVQQKHFAA